MRRDSEPQRNSSTLSRVLGVLCAGSLRQTFLKKGSVLRERTPNSDENWGKGRSEKFRNYVKERPISEAGAKKVQKLCRHTRIDKHICFFTHMQ